MADEVTTDTAPKFLDELTVLLNRRSRENISDTPDYVLASYLMACLHAFEASTVERDRWHGFRPTAALGAGDLIRSPRPLQGGQP